MRGVAFSKVQGPKWKQLCHCRRTVSIRKVFKFSRSETKDELQAVLARQKASVQ